MSASSRKSAASTRRPTVALCTGFPTFTARRLIEKIVGADTHASVYLLAREKFQADAQQFVSHLPPRQRRRVTILVGDVCHLDLGLSGEEYRRLVDELTVIYHAAGAYYLRVPREVAVEVNVEGTRNVLELAGACRQLERLTHFSTAFVSGDRRGVVMEDELDVGQRFRNTYEETKFRAEALVRQASGQIPVTILRPGVIVGDSRTGAIDKLDGPYYLLRFIVSSPLDVHLPLPGHGGAPLHLVPIDYVVDAAHALTHDPLALGTTFHLTDPAPLAARRVYETVADRASRKAPKGSFPEALARAALSIPGLSRLARIPVGFLESFNHLAFYNCQNSLARLRPAGIECPPFESYVDNLIRYVRDRERQRRLAAEEPLTDALD